MTDDMIWVITDEGPENGDDRSLKLYGGARQISAEKLGELVEQFTSKLGVALAKARDIADDYELAEVSINATLNGELGFALVAKVGAEAGVTFTFKKRDPASPPPR